jgi:hypothetical protein
LRSMRSIVRRRRFGASSPWGLSSLSGKNPHPEEAALSGRLEGWPQKDCPRSRPERASEMSPASHRWRALPLATSWGCRNSFWLTVLAFASPPPSCSAQAGLKWDEERSTSQNSGFAPVLRSRQSAYVCPKRTCLRVQKLPFPRELAYAGRVGSQCETFKWRWN